MANSIKAVGLLSGGLDSTLAARLLIDQNIEVHAINFTSPFCSCTSKSAGCAAVVTAIKQLGNIPLKRISLGQEYLDLVKNPQHGYGAGLNPCIDCRIMKIRKAGDYMLEIGASFLFTGEVLGQRPMSQHHRAINIIDRESGLKELTLRPLSASLFPPTVPEKEGWVNRDLLLAFSGRSRKPQIALAHEKGISDYPCPAGGCKLTEKPFADRMRDYFAHTENPSMQDMALLKTGRHFRLENGDEIIVARDEREGDLLISLTLKKGYHLLFPQFPAPVVILHGRDLKAAFDKMMHYTKVEFDPQLEIDYRTNETSSKFLLGDFLESVCHQKQEIPS